MEPMEYRSYVSRWSCIGLYVPGPGTIEPYFYCLWFMMPMEYYGFSTILELISYAPGPSCFVPVDLFNAGLLLDPNTHFGAAFVAMTSLG
jgi:hypothetical protein